MMDECFLGVKGVKVYQDDVLLGNVDDESHAALIKKVLEILKAKNLKINQKNVIFSLIKSNFWDTLCPRTG